MIWHNTSNLGLPRSFSIFSIVRSSQPICSANLQKLAKAEAECIAAYYGVTKKEETTFTKIMGNAVATVEQMTEYIKAKNPDVAQSCLETGNFGFSGSAVTLEQSNFCGMGVTSNGMRGNSFATPQLGIRAQVQHLKAYASTVDLKNECVDPRFKYVARGCAEYVERLGQKENPDRRGWAAGAGYGAKIITILNAMIGIKNETAESEEVWYRVRKTWADAATQKGAFHSLKDLGIGIIFEKENINTLDAKGEVLLTILSSLAQDESRSISENCTWGICRRFETGKHKMSTKRFLGYDTDETGKLVINRTQEPIVVRLYQEFLDGKTTDYIKRIFEREGVKNWDGGTKWQSTTLMSMLENEKYKGDALLQKSYTVDFLTKKRTQNKGEIQMFYVEDDHDAIISKRIWECVQLEINRRKKYLEEHGTNSYSHRPESNPFASKIICGDCNKVFARKGWRSSTGVDRKVWQCSERYKVKGVMGCANRHVEEETLIKAYLMAWNALVENREDFMEQWTEQLQSENLLEGYRAEKFIEYTDGAEPLTDMDTDFMLKTLDHIKVFEDGTLLVVFLDGTEIECKNEEE